MVITLYVFKQCHTMILRYNRNLTNQLNNDISLLGTENAIDELISKMLNRLLGSYMVIQF